MPYRRSYRRTPWKTSRKNTRAVALRKRRYKRRFPLYRSRLPPLAGYGRKKLVRLRYATDITLNPTTGALATYFFAANGMYDPDVTGVGHQPRGFDQQMLGYEHYTVIGSKIQVSVVPQVSGQVQDAQTPFMWGVSIVPTATISPITDTTEMMESRLSGGIYRMAGQNTAAGSRVNAPLITRKFSSKKFFSKRTLTGAGPFSGNTSANPSELAYFCVWGGPAAGASVDPDGQNMLVIIDFIAVLSEPKILDAS